MVQVNSVEGIHKHANGNMNGYGSDSGNIQADSRQPDWEEKEEFLHEHKDVRAGRTGPERELGWRDLLLLALPAFTIFVSLAACTYVAVLYTTQYRHVESSIAGDQVMTYPEVCLDCVRLAKNSYQPNDHDPLLEALTKRREGFVMKCCASNSTQMSALLKAVARKQETKEDPLSEVYPGVKKSSSVSLHKHMVSASKITDSIHMPDYSVVNFNVINGPMERSSGVGLLTDGVVILTTGNYYVYSNLLYKANSTKQEKWSNHIHRISLQASTSTGILLSSIHTECVGCRQDVENSFIGGVFLLRKGDVIQVFLSHVDPVQFTEYSYLGMVILTTSH